MLRDAWLISTLFLLIIASILRHPPLLLVATIIFFTSGLARLWSRYALQRLDYQRRLSEKRVFFGETITLELSITNNKFLPLSWIHVQEEIPEEVLFLRGNASSSTKATRKILSSFISIGWYKRLLRCYPLRCLQRGNFAFGPVTISSGDPFGLFGTSFTLEKQEHLLVYPLILPLEKLGIPSRDPFGELRIKRHLFEDPVQTMSVRDFTHGDPLKRINWKATARLQRLQSKVFERTTSMDLALFLDTRTVAHKHFWGQKIQDLLETAVIVATSISAQSLKDGYRVGIYTTENYWYSNHLIKITPSGHTKQLKEILEALAQIQGVPAISAEGNLTMDKMLIRETSGLAWGTTIVLITAVPTQEIMNSLTRLHRAGRRIALISIGSQSQIVKLKGILHYQVSEDIYQKELSSLKLNML